MRNGDGHGGAIEVGARPSGEGMAGAYGIVESDGVTQNTVVCGIGSSAPCKVVGDGIIRHPCGRVGTVARRTISNGDVCRRFVEVGACPSGEGVALAGGIDEGDGITLHRIARRVRRCHATAVEIVADGIV